MHFVTSEEEFRKRLQLFAGDFLKRAKIDASTDLELIMAQCAADIMRQLSFSDMLRFFTIRAEMGAASFRTWLNEALTEVLIKGIEEKPETFLAVASTLSRVLAYKAADA